MPEANHENCSTQYSNYKPGYDWIPGRFGPPPGIPQRRKEQLDRMTDRDFMNAVMRMGQEEKESLMISEAERLRTFKVLWPNPDCVDYKTLAREGFYYTGTSDRVQCAFCAGFLGNWERGDIPRESHKRFFSYCKMAQRKPCANIPLGGDGDSNDDLPQELRLPVLTVRQDSVSNHEGVTNALDLGIQNGNPYHPRYRVPSVRLGSYKYYNRSYPVRAEDLCEAGFYYEGPGDKVRCFWCDGALEMWSEGDDPWTEHAKWYPGCGYTQATKGKDFIRRCRSEMSAEDVATANDLHYHSCGADFLNVEAGPAATAAGPDISRYDTYQVCHSLGFSHEELQEAFSYNSHDDIKDEQVLLDILLAMRDGDKAQLAEIVRERLEQSPPSEDESLPPAPGQLPPEKRFVDMNELLRNTADNMEDDEARLMIGAMTCHKCNKEQVSAVLLPCGHFVLCDKCSRTNLPQKCPCCRQVVRGACRTYLS